MNVVDRIVNYFDPARGLRRLALRKLGERVEAGYDAAKTGRRAANWRASGTSANAEVGRDLATVRDRLREQVRNNPVVGNAQEKWRSCVVGAGIVCQWRNERLQEKWDAWCERASADGLPHFEAVQSLVANSEWESGEALIRKRQRYRADGVWPPFQVQVLEADFLDLGKTQQTADGYIIHGVEFDRRGRRIAYWLFGQHPGDVVMTGVRNGASLQSQPIPADQITHVREVLRPGQVRTAPRGVAALLTTHDLANWEEAELLRKATEACIVGAVTSPEGESFEFSPEVIDAGGNPVSTMEPGMFLKLKPGELMDISRPTYAGGYEEYKTSRLRDCAAGMRIPYELMTGDYSKSNYSSSRMGVVAFKRSVEAFQWNVMVPLVCEPAALEFLRQLEIFEGPLPDTAHQWQPPAFDLLDRLQEGKADQVELQTGKLSWPQMVGRAGNDPRRQIQEIEEYAPRLREAGIDFFGGSLAAADAAQPDQTQGGDRQEDNTNESA